MLRAQASQLAADHAGPGRLSNRAKSAIRVCGSTSRWLAIGHARISTSLIAHWVRDEIREVAPGLYLGFLFWDHDRLLNFALRVAAVARSAASEPVWR
jgi:hypothetical protein